jgi:hypothetical protein
MTKNILKLMTNIKSQSWETLQTPSGWTYEKHNLDKNIQGKAETNQRKNAYYLQRTLQQMSLGSEENWIMPWKIEWKLLST